MSTDPRWEERRLFEVREPERRFLGPFVAVALLHLVLIVWSASRTTVPRTRPPPVKVVLRRMVPAKAPPKEAPGGGPAPPARLARHRPRKKLQIPKVIPPPPPVEEPPLEPLAAAEELEDDGEGDDLGLPGGTGAGGSGNGSGTGTGNGSGPSRARSAWLTHTDWSCRHPGHDAGGYQVVRIRVEVLPDGKPGRITIVQPAGEAFNRRAIECAAAETYLPALDASGTPIPGAAEFRISFRE